MHRILRFLLALLGLLGTIQALAQTPTPLPVTGNLTQILGTPAPYAGVTFQLYNCPSPVAITGTSVIVQTTMQVQANASGLVNTSVWPNDKINCNLTTGDSEYRVTYVVNGVPTGTPACFQVTSTQGTWNLNTQQPVTCGTTPPNPQDLTVNNLIVNGLFQPNGPVVLPSTFAALSTNGVYNAAQYAGADIGAKVNAAVAAICPVNAIQYFSLFYNAGTIQIPPGTYTYATSIHLNCPVTLDGMDSSLTYTGAGAAIYQGPSGLAGITVHDGIYLVKNLSLSGGSGSAGGIVANYGIIRPWSDNVRFYNWLGGSSTAMWDYLGENFKILNTRGTSNGTGGSAIVVRDYEDANNYMEVDHLEISNNCSTGIVLNGYNSKVTNSKVENCTGAQIQVGEQGRYGVIENSYMEAGGNSGCVTYGDTVYSGHGAIIGVQLKHSYCQAHSSDRAYTGTFVQPANSSITMNSWTFTGNDVENTSQSVMVAQNNLINQPNNQGSGNFLNNGTVAAGQLHTAGANISSWGGSDGEALTIGGHLLIPPSVTGYAGANGTANNVVLAAGTFVAGNLRCTDAFGNEVDCAIPGVRHGSSGTKLQMSDGTGTSGNCAKFAADGSVTDAGAPCSAIANIQITTGTVLIAANTCTANTASTMTGVSATSVFIPPTPTSSTIAVTGWGATGGLSFAYFPTANTFNWSVCNTTGASITPGASITWNVGAR